MTLVFGQDGVAPMWLDQQGVAAAGSGWIWVWWSAGVALTVLVGGAAVAAYLGWLRRHAGTIALARVARMQRVSDEQMERVRAAAASHGGITPLSILVSDTALAAGFGAVATDCGPDDLAGWRRLFEARGVEFPVLAAAARKSPGLTKAKIQGQGRTGRGKADRGES